MITLADLSLNQLTTAYGTLAGIPVKPKYFNSRATGIRRLEALLAERSLTVADALHAAGVEADEPADIPPAEPVEEPAAIEDVQDAAALAADTAPTGRGEPADVPTPPPAAEANHGAPVALTAGPRTRVQIAVQALRPFAALEIGHLGDKADDHIVFGINDTAITVGDVRRAHTVVETLAARATKATPLDRAETPAKTPRTGTKQEAMIAMLRRDTGATIGEIAEATGWQHHTVRGAIAGALKKKLGLTIVSERPEGAAERTYRISQ